MKKIMKKSENINITRYETDCFYVFVMESESEFEAWLTEKTMGISNLMFGCPKYQPSFGTLTLKDFLADVEECLDDYINEYYAEHFNGWRDENV